MKPATAKTIENRKATSPLCMLWSPRVSLISRAINIAAGSARPGVYGSSGTAAQMPSFDHPRKFHANGTKTVACLKHLPAQICCRVGGFLGEFSEFVMAPRAYWKGYLKLSLVSCPIALFPATSEREKRSARPSCLAFRPGTWRTSARVQPGHMGDRTYLRHG